MLNIPGKTIRDNEIITEGDSKITTIALSCILSKIDYSMLRDEGTWDILITINLTEFQEIFGSKFTSEDMVHLGKKMMNSHLVQYLGPKKESRTVFFESFSSRRDSPDKLIFRIGRSMSIEIKKYIDIMGLQRMPSVIRE